MKKRLTIIILLAATLCACQNKGESSEADENALQATVDSLTQVNEQKDSEINEMLSLLNDVEEGFRQINEAQGRVTVDRMGEGSNSSARIHSDISRRIELVQRILFSVISVQQEQGCVIVTR